MLSLNMKCEYCENEVPDGVSKCPVCGVPAPDPNTQAAPQGGHEQQAVQQIIYVQQTVTPAKSRVAYILFALFLGGFGAHNFYAGYTGRGITQLLLTVLLCWTIVVPCLVFVWIIIEVITVNKDSKGERMI